MITFSVSFTRVILLSHWFSLMHTIDQWFQAWRETVKYRSLSMNPFFSVLSLFFLFLPDSLACSLFTSKGLDTKLPDSQSDCLSFLLTLLSSSFSTSLVYWGHRSGREADRGNKRKKREGILLQRKERKYYRRRRQAQRGRSPGKRGLELNQAERTEAAKKRQPSPPSDTRREMLKPLSRGYYISRITRDAKVNSRCSFFAAAVST